MRALLEHPIMTFAAAVFLMWLGEKWREESMHREVAKMNQYQ